MNIKLKLEKWKLWSKNSPRGIKNNKTLGNRREVKIRSKEDSASGKEGVTKEWVYLPSSLLETTETNRGKNIHINIYTYKSSVFKTLDIRQCRTLVLERRDKWGASYNCPYCLNRVSRLWCQEEELMWNPGSSLSWGDRAESLGKPRH